MRQGKHVSVIIPALNEEKSIGKVLDAIPPFVDQVIVGDNGSTDQTAKIARSKGAVVVLEEAKGYGAACLAALAEMGGTDIVAFVDADYADRPEKLDLIVDPIADNELDMVIGTRTQGTAEPGALTPQQKFGNALACFLIRIFWKHSYTDLGPFRAISAPALAKLDMRDRAFGWTVEMQIKAIQHGLRIGEVQVPYLPRIGKSKISGTVKGTILAGHGILSTIFKTAIGHKKTSPK